MRESEWKRRGEKEEGKARFSFPNSGFLCNDWAIMVLSLDPPNETRGPASPMMFISLHFSSVSLFFICDIKIVQNPHFICMTAHCFLPFFLIYPYFFLHIQQSPLAKVGICGLLSSGGDVFWEISSANNLLRYDYICWPAQTSSESLLRDTLGHAAFVQQRPKVEHRVCKFAEKCKNRERERERERNKEKREKYLYLM